MRMMMLMNQRGKNFINSLTNLKNSSTKVFRHFHQRYLIYAIKLLQSAIGKKFYLHFKKANEQKFSVEFIKFSFSPSLITRFWIFLSLLLVQFSVFDFYYLQLIKLIKKESLAVLCQRA